MTKTRKFKLFLLGKLALVFFQNSEEQRRLRAPVLLSSRGTKNKKSRCFVLRTLVGSGFFVLYH